MLFALLQFTGPLPVLMRIAQLLVKRLDMKFSGRADALVIVAESGATLTEELAS